MHRAILGLVGLFSFQLSAEEVTVSTELVTVALSDQVSNLYFDSGKEICLFKANITGIGAPVDYKGPRRFILRASANEFSQDPLPPPQATVYLPLDSERVLLACIKTADKPLRMIAYDIANSRIASGEYQFFNFSRSIVSVIFGKQRFTVKPGTDTLVTDSSWKKDVSEIDIQIATIKDNTPTQVYSSQWGHGSGKRSFVFLSDGAQTYKPIRISRFYDIAPEVKKNKDP